MFKKPHQILPPCYHPQAPQRAPGFLPRLHPAPESRPPPKSLGAVALAWRPTDTGSSESDCGISGFLQVSTRSTSVISFHFISQFNMFNDSELLNRIVDI